MAGAVTKEITAGEAQSTRKADAAAAAAAAEVEFVKCACCGFTEECTAAYISRIRAKHQGRWICGLCSEAFKDEIARSEGRIGTEEALNRLQKFRTSTPSPIPMGKLISAVKQLLLRSLDSPRANQVSPMRKDGPGLARSQSESA